MSDKKITSCLVLENIKIAENIYKMTVKSDLKINPGQFLMLRSWKGVEPYLSRPISICDSSEDTDTYLYLKKGRGTEIFTKLKKGDNLTVVGPLGNGFDIENIKGKVAIVAGGIGIAPFLYLCKKLKEKNCTIDIYIGYNSEVYFAEEIKPYVDNMYIYTMDGSKGKKGYPLQDLKEENYDKILSCGPTPMMNSLREMVKDKTKLYLSLENRMGCGIGACLSCSVKTCDGMKKVCKDGPVFRGDELI